jgi:PKD repeat protein
VAVTATANPTAVFTFSPTTPKQHEEILFNASSSTAAAGRSIVSYNWDVGTGRTGSGVTVTKTYDAVGTYTITLTVTDDIGKIGVTSKTVPVASSGLEAKFVFSPSAPTTATTVWFDATTSVVGAGRTIVSYSWNFGDSGTPQVTTSPLKSHQFLAAGVYSVVLTITDDIGNTASVPVTVTVT